MLNVKISEDKLATIGAMFETGQWQSMTAEQKRDFLAPKTAAREDLYDFICTEKSYAEQVQFNDLVDVLANDIVESESKFKLNTGNVMDKVAKRLGDIALPEPKVEATVEQPKKRVEQPKSKVEPKVEQESPKAAKDLSKSESKVEQSTKSSKSEQKVEQEPIVVSVKPETRQSDEASNKAKSQASDKKVKVEGKPNTEAKSESEAKKPELKVHETPKAAKAMSIGKAVLNYFTNRFKSFIEGGKINPADEQFRSTVKKAVVDLNSSQVQPEDPKFTQYLSGLGDQLIDQMIMRQSTTIQQPVAADASEQKVAKNLGGLDMSQFVKQPEGRVSASELINKSSFAAAGVRLDNATAPEKVVNPVQKEFNAIINSDDFKKLSVSEKCDVMFRFIDHHPNVARIDDYWRNLNLDYQQRFNALRRHVKFMESFKTPHVCQLLALTNVVVGKLPIMRRKYKVPEKFMLVQVPRGSVESNMTKFDMTFLLRTEMSNKTLVLYVDSVPKYDWNEGRWTFTVASNEISTSRVKKLLNKYDGSTNNSSDEMPVTLADVVQDKPLEPELVEPSYVDETIPEVVDGELVK